MLLTKNCLTGRARITKMALALRPVKARVMIPKESSPTNDRSVNSTKGIQTMRLKIAIIAMLGAIALVVAGTNLRLPSASAQDEKASKVQPKDVTLGKDSQSDKYGEVAFNHENHSLKTYSIDGKSVIPCTECHHTDQPASALKPPLKTSE